MHLFKGGMLAVVLATFAAPVVPKHAGSFTVIGFGNPVVVGREDPIISPGLVSQHVHTVIGGNAFLPAMSDTQAMKSTCTSSQVKNDLSNYWVPSLFFHASNGSFVPVQATQFNVYYVLVPVGSLIDGIRMLT